MARYSDPRQLVEAQKAWFKTAQVDAVTGHKKLAELSHQDMLELLSGGVNKKDLADLNHPFGRGIHRMAIWGLSKDIRSSNRSQAEKSKMIAALNAQGWTPSAARRGYRQVDALNGGSAERKASGWKREIPLLPINRQSGNLYRATKLRKVGTLRGIQSFVSGPKGVPYARYILAPGGTKYMVARPFFPEIKKRWRARNHAFMDHYVRKQRNNFR